MLQVVIQDTGQEMEITLDAHLPVAATKQSVIELAHNDARLRMRRQILTFAGEEIDDSQAWGDGWVTSGMASGCRIELVSTGGNAEPEVWVSARTGELHAEQAAPEQPAEVWTEMIETLVNIGFSEEGAAEALKATEGDMDLALERLMAQVGAADELRLSGDLRALADARVKWQGAFAKTRGGKLTAKVAPEIGMLNIN